MKRWMVVALVLPLLLATRCVPVAGPGAAPEPTPVFTVPEEVRLLIDAARQALAERLDRLDEAINLVDVEPLEWPTAAMGCPEPGQMYAQVITPGYRIVFRVEAQEYEVHINKEGQIVFCSEELGEEEAMQVPQAAQPAVTAAKRDLAARAGVAMVDIQVVGIEPVQWSDSSLGCPEPGKMYLQVITPGYRVVLQAADRAYEYHTDRGRRAVLCEGRAGVIGKPAVQNLAALREAVDQARADLAARQGVKPAAVQVTDIKPVAELTKAADCPEAEKLTGEGTEYQIILQAEGRAYVYRARGNAVVLCAGSAD